MVPIPSQPTVGEPSNLDIVGIYRPNLVQVDDVLGHWWEGFDKE